MRDGVTQKKCKSQDVTCRVTCTRAVKQVYSTFCFGCENWSWWHFTMKMMKGWEAKMT